MIVVECAFSPGDFVSLRTDPTSVRIVKGVISWLDGGHTYLLSYGTEESEHREQELMAMRDAKGKQLSVGSMEDDETVLGADQEQGGDDA